jgi:hypothetical protein
MAYSIRTRYHLKDTVTEGESTYIPQIYIKNKNWNPLPAPIEIENQLTIFEKALKRERQLLSKKIDGTNLFNLAPLQLTTLNKSQKKYYH